MPNAGKSSLFNYLIREDRSIVTDAPGTTRDWIEAVISLDDIPLRLADTAGLRKMDAPGSKEVDEAERIGVERSMELLDKADLVLYVVDGEKGFTDDDREFLVNYSEAQKKKPIIALWNKADITPSLAFPDEKIIENIKAQFLSVSAKTGEGIPELLRLMAGLLERNPISSSTADDQLLEAAGPGSIRQKDLIDSALSEIEEALAMADRGESLDLIAPLIRSAVNALGEITGEVSNDDILKVMFSRFCVGK
jgi:tRNA modification GTPase